MMLRFADADRCSTVTLAKQGCAKSPNVEAFEGRNFSKGNSVTNNTSGSPILSLQVLCCLFFKDRVSVISLCPGTHYVEQDGFKFTEIRLLLPTKC